DNYDELKGYTTRNEQAISVLQGQTTELNEAVEGILQADYDEKFLQLTADMVRIDEFITTSDDFQQRVSDELSRLGEEAAKIDDNYDELKGYTTRNEQAISVLQGQTTELNEAVEEILKADYDEKFLNMNADIERLTSTQDDLSAWVEMANDELAKLQGLDATEIDDFHQRVSDELSRLGEEAAKVDDNYDELKGYITRNEQAISVLQGQTAELNEAVEEILKADYDEKFLNMNADIERLTSTQDDLAAWVETANDELSKLQGLDATEIDDFHQRVSDELARINEANEEQTNFNQSVSDALQKLVGLDADEIGDFNTRISAEVARLADEIEKIQEEIAKLQATQAQPAK
ncbi:MAG: hypothetical protein K2O24_02220, partial [Muribaculaceae bacterium]|nr:hypothetical protein [Muribaculaceae bacterium]